METAGKDAKAIKLATGWERGADGLWRYEIMDDEINQNAIFNHREDGMSITLLGELLSGSELLKAYPQLDDMVVVYQELPLGTLGGYSPANKMGMPANIVLSDMFLSRRENPEWRAEVEKMEQEPIIRAWSDAMMAEPYDIKAYENAEQTFKSSPLWDEYNNLLMGKGKYPRLIKGIGGREALLHEVQHAIQDIEGFAMGGNTKREGYNQLAGEVEARNVEKRANMTMAERLASLAEETEDVARKDQIILRESLAMGAQSEVRYHLSNPYGGNSGYVGYSMSKRAAEARDEGRYPKSDFKKVYDMPQATLDALVNAGVINDKEWHHTSMYGNKTTFYGWGAYGESPYMSEYYKAHKTEIDEAAKSHGDLTPFLDGFEKFEADVDANNTFIAQLKAQAEAEREALRREEEQLFQKRIDEAKREIEDSERKRAYVEANLPAEFVANNGVTIKPKGYGEYPAYRDGEAITSASSSNKRKAASKARAEFKEQIIAPLEESYASQREAKFSLRDIPAYQASAEVSVMLGGYKSKQITLNGLVKAVENITKKYSKTGLLETALEEYDNGNTKEFIDAIKGFVSIYPPKGLRDYSGDKATIEETFGGIWIEDTEEFAKFVSAVNKSPFEEDGEGIAYTDNYFYAYYRNVENHPVPYASVYLNKDESQDVVNQVNEEIGNVRTGERVKKYIDSAIKGFGRIQNQNNANDGNNSGISFRGETGSLGSDILRKGRYYDNPSLYSKVKRADSGSRGQGRVNYSLITPEMDASYLDAVERGDMETAQRMVLEAAKLAMPDTWVVDENGNPRVMYHGDRKKARYIFSTDTFFTPNAEYARRYINGTGEVYATYLNIEKPFDIRDKRAYDIFTEFRGGRKPVETTSGAMDWAEYSYEDLQEYLEDVAPNRYDGFILDEGADPDGKGGVVHRGLSYVPFAPNQIKSADPVTYDDNGNVIPLSERFNPEKEDIRYSLMRPTDEEVTFDNFFDNTSAVFTLLPKSEAPQREADYESKRWDGLGVSSRYWYGEDEQGKYVVRASDHWSSYPRGANSRKAFEDNPYHRIYTQIASCRWALDMADAPNIATPRPEPRASQEEWDAYNKARKAQKAAFEDTYIDGKTMYGKAYLDDFTKWKAEPRHSFQDLPFFVDDEGEVFYFNDDTEVTDRPRNVQLLHYNLGELVPRSGVTG